MNTHLVFVYNAGSDLFSTVTDFAHKLFSPSTYACHLCALTYGNFSMKQHWKAFIANLPLKTVFLHKDEFEKQYQLKTTLPAIFLFTEGVGQEIVSKQQIDACHTLDELKNLVSNTIKHHVQHHHSNL